MANMPTPREKVYRKAGEPYPRRSCLYVVEQALGVKTTENATCSEPAAADLEEMLKNDSLGG